MAATKVDLAHWRQLISAIPQLVVGDACGGLKTEQLDRIAERWGFPLNGNPVDLGAVLRRLAEFLKRYGPILKDIMEASEEDGEEGSLSIQYLKSKIAKNEADTYGKRLLNEQKERNLVDRTLVHCALNKLADRIIKTGERAQRKWGTDGFEFFNDLAIGFQEDMREVFDAPSYSEEGDSEV